jgi:tripartite-type tricarboxylate transporter receptor subunit TctC
MPGMESMEFDVWAGVQVHKNTPEDVVASLNKAFYAALGNPETRKAFEASGNVVTPVRSPVELAKLYSSEIDRYRGIARSIDLQPQ